MKRRQAIQRIAVMAGGLLALPSWANGWTLSDIKHKSSFSFVEQETLASVVDTIIPMGNSIGAMSVGVDKFLQKLIENCYEKDVQENVKTQLLELESGATGVYGKPFHVCAQLQRQELLLRLSVSDSKAEKDFFDLIKSETIRGFNTSKEVMLGYLKYKVVPGHYYGCVDATA